MPNDARCGMLVGVVLVAAVAVLFYQKETPTPPSAKATAARPPVVEPATKTMLPALPVSRSGDAD